MLPAAVSCKRNQLLKFRLWNIIVENHYLNMSPLVIANKIVLSLFTEVAIWFLCSYQIGLTSKIFSFCCDVSLFILLGHPFTIEDVSLTKNTTPVFQSKPNLTDVLFLIQLFQFDRKMSHDELLSIENWLTKAGRVLN